ncbi:MAG: dCTP deaminase [Candidatus Micrarchaeota archaeon]|nr:dCTP deaminase [Candidatus Micrarchaeota archaeon]
MGILSNIDIKKAIKNKEIIIDPMPPEECFGPGSVDIALSNVFYLPKKKRPKQLDAACDSFELLYDKTEANEVILNPGDCILAVTEERLILAPNICGWIQGRSRFARMGLTAHVASSFIQPGSQNRQVLEIANLSKVPIKISKGLRLCQIIFERTDSKPEVPYSKIGRFAKQ